ncbi:MAG: FAD binding domain-containing protein [Anaerolineae bacterium]|nr:FAD binding domain-containing protein [Anaerolineae bacterium]
MLPSTLNYAAPTTLGAAVDLLATHPDAVFTAGSYRLLIDLKMQRIDAGTLVDLRKLSELYGIASVEDGAEYGVEIGAMTALSTLASDVRLLAHYGALAEAASETGDAQIRNMAALGGTLAYDASAGDVAAALLALDAVIHTHHSKGQRSLDAADFFTSDGKTALRHDEIITMVALPSTGARSVYAKFTHPATLEAIIGVAAAVTLDDAGRVAACRLGVCGSVAQAKRLSAAEAAILGGALDETSIARAAASAADGVEWLPSLQASAEYRAHRLGVMTARALRRLVKA